MAQTQIFSIAVKHARDLHVADSADGREWWENAKWILTGMFGGETPGFTNTVTVEDGGAFASQFGTFTDHATANDTFTFGNIVITAKASGAGTGEFNVGTTATASAAGLAAALNANTTFAAGFLATSALGVITMTALFPGTAQQAIPLAESCSVFTWNATALAGGANNAPVTYTF